jgi:peptide/nickel transport system substrate-binding protein
MKVSMRVSVSLLFILVMVLSACTPAPQPTTGAATETAKPVEATATRPLLATSTLAPTVEVVRFKEAPEMAELVKSGKLPEVTDRLPENPMVVVPVESIGEYGGTWRMGAVGGGDSLSFQRIFGYEPLLRWNYDFTSYIPNVAESFEANADGSVFTVKLRKGMKFSDGQPLTTEDVRFWYEDVLMNTDITAKPDAVFMVAGKPVVVEIIDDYTFTFNFAGPYGFFPFRMANNTAPITYPKHYMEQFHPKYNPDAEKNAEAAGAKSWVEYFTQKATDYVNIDKPTLFAWNLNSPYGGNSSVLTAVRNPYYWKVDPEGNQLPYIDKLQYTVHQAVDTLTLQALNGEIDMQYRHFGTLENKSIFFDNQEKGDYRLLPVKSSLGNAMCMYPTLTTKDENVRALLQNKDIRIGLSYAIDRQEIIDLIFLGQATPQQFAPDVNGPFANEQMAYQYTQFDLAKANEHLDKAGLTQRDSAGYRLRPDGKRVSFTAENATAFPAFTDALNLVKETWKEVGVELNVKTEDRSIQWERKAANQTEFFIWQAGGGAGLDVILNVQAYFPDRSAAWFAPAWGDWYASGGAKGEEPDAEMKTMMAMYDEMKTLTDFDQQVAMMKDIIQMSADYFPAICISNQPDVFAIVKNNMHNLPEFFVESATALTPAPTNPETYFFSQ